MGTREGATFETFSEKEKVNLFDKNRISMG